jgi:nucleoside-diphosphate-sugar epimerase
MRIFITGGTGFVGKYIVDELRRGGHELLLLSRSAHRRQPGLQFLKGDISDVSTWGKKLKMFKPEAAIHLAWEGLPSQEFDITVKNLVGGLNCIRALGEAGCRTVVVAGSDQEYGHTGKKANEKSLTKPYNMLFAGKTSLYWLGAKIAEQYQMNFIWARMFFIYGAGQRSGALIPYMVSSLKKGEDPDIRNPYGANDFIYIEDLARAVALLTTRKPKSQNEIYNIGSGKLTTTSKIIQNVYKNFGLVAPKFSKNPSGPATWKGCYADIAKMKKDYGWKPQVSLEEGIKKMVNQLK